VDATGTPQRLQNRESGESAVPQATQWNANALAHCLQNGEPFGLSWPQVAHVMAKDPGFAVGFGRSRVFGERTGRSPCLILVRLLDARSGLVA
jgi:hypothetical protein